MNVFYLLVGVSLLVLAVVDLLWTTLWVDGSGGPLSSRLTTGLWRGLRTLGGRRSWILSLAGPVMLVTSLAAWVVLFWAGWTFVFAADADSLIDTRDHEPVTWPGRIWYVAYSMFTVGNGDFSPRDGFWQVTSSVIAATGMMFVTLGVSYVLSVLGAVALKRSFASSVTGLAKRGEALVERAWVGGDFHSLDLPLSTIASQLETLADQHNTYPILHYYHSEKANTASVVAVAVLDEALTMLRYGVPEEHWPNAVVLAGARSSVESYLRTLNSAFIQPAAHAPPPPDLARLRGRGIPTVKDAAFSEALEGLEERRRKLLGMLHADAWPWPERDTQKETP